MKELTIGDVARQVKLKPSTLRYYEQMGLLRAPKRVRGQRRYDDDVLQQIAVIKLAQRAGFTLTLCVRQQFRPEHGLARLRPCCNLVPSHRRCRYWQRAP